MDNTLSLISKIQKMAESGAFKRTIDYARFPFFRNLERNTKITFDFPFTVFLGQNGCGKSSTLQGLYGCPAGKSLESFWFSTKTDPIQEGEGGERHCVIYSYKNSDGTELEVVKRRIKDDQNPDLWETSDPLKQYGMDPKAKRNEPILKEVLYRDFRSLRSGFEKAFQNKTTRGYSKFQEFLRYRSGYLQKALDRKTGFSRPWCSVPVDLTPDELIEISAILGKNYVSGQLAEHTIFGECGYSVRFKTNSATYSEAFAGSGEIAVVVLVHEILQAKPETLILLDEPETSLHPGAQLRLKDFLLRQIIKSKHQIILSTHSQNLVARLPSKAIKVFHQHSSGKFSVLNESLPEEAFFFIGHPLADKKQIVVEDKLGKALFELAAESLGDATASLFQVNFYPGGESVIKDDITIYSRKKEANAFIVFDGDQKPSEPVFDVKSLTLEEIENVDQVIIKLDAEIFKQTGMKIKFRTDSEPGGGGGNRQQGMEQRRDYLRFWARNVFFFPFSYPEQKIWDDKVADQFLDLFAVKEKGEASKASFRSEGDCKKKFAILVDAVSGGSGAGNVALMHQMFLNSWKNRDEAGFKEVVQIVEKIKSLPNQ